MAGYSGKPLAMKLGIKAGMRVVLLNVPATVRRELAEVLAEVDEVKGVKGLGGESDYVHFFAENVADLRGRMAALKRGLKKTGMMWISWRKGKVNTDLTDNEVRAVALEFGLVDVKVCAVDEVWSGLKLVYRVKDR